MAQRTLPVLFMNLGGEMMYILDQRLKAQAIEKDKAGKVMNDIVSTMFNRRFIEEIFVKHQPIYSRRVLKTMFDKLAHASIMRLNSNSMDKLYDLMTMAVKYQVLMCHNPKHIISLTLNHLDAILRYVTCSVVRKNVEVAFQYFIQNYGGMSVGELQAIRHCILNFFQDIHVRVSVFLQDEVQHSDGRFVMPPNTTLYPGVENPGTIRFMNSSGEVVETSKFHPGQVYKSEPGELGLEIGGKRSTNLGHSIYAGKSAVGGLLETARATVGQRSPKKAQFPRREEGNGDLAKEELNLLAKLIGTETNVKNRETFRLNLFDTDTTEDEVEVEEKAVDTEDTTVNIDLKSGRTRGELEKIINEMTVSVEEVEEDDLLSLMDKAV